MESVWYGTPPEAAPSLIFLHEGLGCVSLWKRFLEKLATKTACGALVFSRLGYGKSASCELPSTIDFMHHQDLCELPEILSHYKIRNFILVGHSDGASIALIHAAESPSECLLGIVNEAPHVFCEKLTTESIKKVQELYLSGNIRERLQKHHGANVDCAFKGCARVWLHSDFSAWNIEECLPKIRVPQLIVQGNEDEYRTSE
jgi:pimeloyl-ACP methyl ester carboxylesterase